ncbi:hypothetical protein EK21DRAFT_92717 [Setomelanomma holmii]|uniref:Uncharacterized protein n=1 Tax=Setomelanomma holmii TaxID=210430 RepID=A0A9P4H3M5_9PLEO|nr:hypothetical protein EK21DRAFT_92717 [Setomelanomma holmii]
MDLKELATVLIANGNVTQATVDAIEHHASRLGESICNEYCPLNGIMTRYETLIRHRWTKKSIAQRKKTLQAAWPDIPEEEGAPNSSEALPHVNLKDLTKSKPLLIFLNARGRNLPWTFARSEEAFDPLVRMLPCVDKKLCKSTTAVFTQDPEPTVYGRMFGGWTELQRRLAEFETILRHDADMIDQVHALAEFRHVAEWMLRCLLPRLRMAFLGAPSVRKLILRNSDGTMRPNPSMTETQDRMFDYFMAFQEPNEIIKDSVMLVLVLQKIDEHIQRYPDVRQMMSGRILNLLTDVSILGECLRQPLQLIYPVKEKFNYPVHKRPTRENVWAMRAAEAHLDGLWNSLYSYMEEKTGEPLHKIISDCLFEGGGFVRTALWIAPEMPKPSLRATSDSTYMPFPRSANDKALQIIGNFDKISIEEKAKTKTRAVGVLQHDADAHARDPEPVPADTPATQRSRTCIVDKRSHKVFKALFHVPVDELGEVPRTLKWDEFKRAMARMGFAVEKLQGCACQFTPTPSMDLDVQRRIHFNEPPLEADIPYNTARRFGRRLERAYGWNGSTFKLA